MNSIIIRKLKEGYIVSKENIRLGVYPEEEYAAENIERVLEIVGRLLHEEEKNEQES